MDDPCFVGGPDSSRDLQHQGNGTGGVEWVIVGQHVPQSATLKQLHHDVDVAVSRRAKVSYGNSVCVLQPAGSARFTAKSDLRRFVFDEARIQHLNSHRTIYQKMGRTIYRAHTTDAK